MLCRAAFTMPVMRLLYPRHDLTPSFYNMSLPLMHAMGVRHGHALIPRMLFVHIQYCRE